MLGLGETHDQLIDTFKDVAADGVDILTLGQYLRPSKENAAVKKYYTPDEFDQYQKIATDLGIRHVFFWAIGAEVHIWRNMYLMI